MAIQWNNNQNVAWFGLLRGFFTMHRSLSDKQHEHYVRTYEKN